MARGLTHSGQDRAADPAITQRRARLGQTYIQSVGDASSLAAVKPGRLCPTVTGMADTALHRYEQRGRRRGIEMTGR